MREKDVYIEILNLMISKMSNLLGDKIALSCAKRAPLVMDLNGKVENYYGGGETVVDILLKQYENIMGDVCHCPIQRAIEDVANKYPVKLPERIKICPIE